MRRIAGRSIQNANCDYSRVKEEELRENERVVRFPQYEPEFLPYQGDNQTNYQEQENEAYLRQSDNAEAFNEQPTELWPEMAGVHDC